MAKKQTIAVKKAKGKRVNKKHFIIFKMKSTSGWKDNGNGTNSSGFSGLPGGIGNDGKFYDIDNRGYWWSSAKEKKGSAWSRRLFAIDGEIQSNGIYRRHGLSVRCIRD